MNKTILLLLTLLTPLISQADVLLRDTHGNSAPFSSLRGKWVIINYWAQWCPACLDEIPALNRFYSKHKDQPVALYAVNYDGIPLLEQKGLIQRYKISYPNLLKDPANELHLGDIIGLPATFIFNPKGELVKKLYGEQSVSSLEKVVKMN